MYSGGVKLLSKFPVLFFSVGSKEGYRAGVLIGDNNGWDLLAIDAC